MRDAFHRLEYDTTFIYLDKYLPKHGHILDAGGGPGRYTIALAKRGYDVTLLDITPANLAFAERMIKKNKVQDRVTLIEGSITDMSELPTGKFDAVICLGGPLSHVQGKANRDKAVSELTRVAKHGAPIFVGAFGRMGCLLIGVRGWPDEITLPSFEQFVKSGDDHLWQHEYYAHFFMPEEFEKVFDRRGLKLMKLVGLEGIGMDEEAVVKFARHNPKAWRKFVKMHDMLAEHPASVGMSIHILAVCRKS